MSLVMKQNVNIITHSIEIKVHVTLAYKHYIKGHLIRLKTVLGNFDTRSKCFL